LVAALAGTFVLRAASYCAGTIIPISLGLKSQSDPTVTANLAALISVTFYAAEMVGAPILGSLSDRYGRKLFMVFGAVSGGVAIQLLGFSAIIPVLVLVRVLEGLSTASSAPATLGYLSAETAHSEQLRGRIMGLYEAATVVGLTVGAYIAGRMFEAYGVFAFTLTALVYALALVVFCFVRDRPVTSHGAHAESFDVAGHFSGLLRRMANPRIMRFAPAWLAANAYLGAWLNIGPFLASATPNPNQYLMQGFSPTTISNSVLVFGVLFTAGAVGWGYLMPYLGRQVTLLFGVLGLGITVVAMWLLNATPASGADEQVAVLLGLIAVGIVIESGFTPAALAYLAEIAESHAQDRGSVMGVYSVLLSVGQLLGAGLAGPMADRWGMNGLIILSALLCVIATATVLLLGRVERRERRAAAHP
jgi:MFS family permease